LVLVPHELLYHREIDYKKHCPLTALCLLVYCMLELPILLTAINVGALPTFPDVINWQASSPTDFYDRRIALIPWHIVFTPIILVFLAASLFCGFILFHQISNCYNAGYCQNCGDILEQRRSLECLLISAAGLGGLAFALFFILLGFHLEFPYHVHIAYSFIPLYIVEIYATVMYVIYFGMLKQLIKMFNLVTVIVVYKS